MSSQKETRTNTSSKRTKFYTIIIAYLILSNILSLGITLSLVVDFSSFPMFNESKEEDKSPAVDEMVIHVSMSTTVSNVSDFYSYSNIELEVGTITIRFNHHVNTTLERLTVRLLTNPTLTVYNVKINGTSVGNLTFIPRLIYGQETKEYSEVTVYFNQEYINTQEIILTGIEIIGYNSSHTNVRTVTQW